MKQIAGHCAKCGAPYYVESPFWSVIPPTPEPLCNCWNVPKTYTSNGTVFKIREENNDREGQTQYGRTYIERKRFCVHTKETRKSD